MELALGPVAFEAFVFVKSALPRIVDGQQVYEMGPRKTQEHRDRQSAWRTADRLAGFAHRW